MLYTVYILYSSQYNKVYIGYTSNLLERFKSHNCLGKKGWTVRFRPWQVIYCEYFIEKADAEHREKQLKGGKGREWIKQKINGELERIGFISA